MHSNPHLKMQHENGGPNQFLITREKLAQVVETANALQHCGGIHNIVSALRTSLDAGIPGDQADLNLRRQAFGSNSTSPQNRSPQTVKYIKRLLSDALRDSTILLLVCCAMLSLAIGVKTNGAAEVIIDAAFTILSISLVAFCGALIRYLKDRWMRRKSLKRKNKIRVVRNGLVYEILETELVVGDIVFLQSGDYVPADGIFIDVDKTDDHPSLSMGAKVNEGHCRMMVTSVGENTERSRLLRSIGINQTHLLVLDKIEKTNSKLEKIWLSLSLILLVLQFVRCFMMKAAQEDKDSRNLGVKNTVEDLMKESIHLMKKERLKANSLVAMLCVLLFVSRDGLPLALFISLLYGVNRMKSVDAVAQRIEASATVGLVTTICACATNDLALDHSKMADLWIGFQLIQDGLIGGVDGRTLEVLREGMLVHAQADGGLEEISLLTWARAVLGLDMEFLRACSSMARFEDGGLRCWIVKREVNLVHVHWKGDPRRILYMCSRYYSVDGKTETLDANKKASLLQIVYSFLGCSQRCFAFAYKQEIKAEEGEEEEEEDEDLESDLTLLGFVSLKNPYSPQLIEAITDFRRFGVEIKLMVDCDINTARIMAFNTGLVRPQDNDRDSNSSTSAVVEAGDFRSSSDSDRIKMADNIHVMANASPADKLLMLRCLRQKGHVIAAAAANIRDSPLLREADIGLFMDGEMTNLSKEDGDITVASSNFSQIIGIVNLGRKVCKNLEKLVRLQLTMEISTFTINIISLAATSKAALSSFQLVWIYVIVGIVGGIGVAITTIDNSFSSETNGDPVYGSGRVVNRSMCRNIALQCFFQVCVILTMVMNGRVIFKVNESTLQSMVFNCYAFCQVFLLIPAIELKRNDVVAGLFEGRSCLFLAVVAAVGILQVALVEIMGVVADCPRLELKQWCICIGIASFSLPLNFICFKFHYLFVNRLFFSFFVNNL